MGVVPRSPDFWEFCENGDHVDAWQMKKNFLSPQGLFRQEKVCTHNSRDGAGGSERWGKPIFPTWFFSFFYFLRLSKSLLGENLNCRASEAVRTRKPKYFFSFRGLTCPRSLKKWASYDATTPNTQSVEEFKTSYPTPLLVHCLTPIPAYSFHVFEGAEPERSTCRRNFRTSSRGFTHHVGVFKTVRQISDFRHRRQAAPS